MWYLVKTGVKRSLVSEWTGERVDTYRMEESIYKYPSCHKGHRKPKGYCILDFNLGSPRFLTVKKFTNEPNFGGFLEFRKKEDGRSIRG